MASPTLRRPTNPEDAYAWYQGAIEAARLKIAGPPIHEDEPQPGWYKHRFDPRGVFVPARIWLVQRVLDGELIAPEELRCEVGGDAFDPDELWLSLSQNPITKAEFDHLMRVRQWARAQRPGEPEASPTKPIDLFTVQPPRWGKSRGSKK